jgi:Holliday junction DNA helicase RuvA
MIAYIRGTILEKTTQLLIVENQGIGYAVAVCDDRLYKKDQQVALYVYTHWNQENGPQLYGFDSSGAKIVFQQILSCTGCGPKIGLAVLSAMPSYHFLQIVATGDAHALSQVHGIGHKKAELIIMQLKDKVAKMAPEEFHPTRQAGLHKIKQISAALTALHYKPLEVSRALDVINTQQDLESRSFDDLLKQALSVLAKSL